MKLNDFMGYDFLLCCNTLVVDFISKNIRNITMVYPIEQYPNWGIFMEFPILYT